MTDQPAVEILEAYPHDSAAYTQGLEIRGSTLFESTGLEGRSSVRKVDLRSGQLRSSASLPADQFGEGLTVMGDSVLQLTWKDGIATVFDTATLSPRRQMGYTGEGWGLCYDGTSLFMSDGTSTLKRRNPAGFRSEEYLTARLSMRAQVPGGSGETMRAAGCCQADSGLSARFARSADEVARALSVEPDVGGVTLGRSVPGSEVYPQSIELEGDAPGETVRRVSIAVVDESFFDLFGAAILSGRGFHPGGLDAGSDVTVVNQSFVREVMGGRNPVGLHFRYASETGISAAGVDTAAVRTGPWYEIVGVVEDLPMSIDPGTRATARNAGVYRLYGDGDAMAVRVLRTADNEIFIRDMSTRVTLRTRGDPLAFAPRLVSLVAATEPDLILEDVGRLDDVQRQTLMRYATWTQLAAAGGTILLLLAVSGIYSIMSFTVARRTREIGIRVALGASRFRVVVPLFGRALLQAAAGIGVGAFLLLRLRDFSQPASGGGVVVAVGLAIVTLACLAASVVPTLHAFAIEPVDAMRSES